MGSAILGERTVSVGLLFTKDILWRPLEMAVVEVTFSRADGKNNCWCESPGTYRIRLLRQQEGTTELEFRFICATHLEQEYGRVLQILLESDP